MKLTDSKNYFMNNMTGIRNVSLPFGKISFKKQPVPCSDVFERKTPKTEDNSFNSFKNWAEQTNFGDKVVDIVERTGRIIGEGAEGCVYEIPDCENWVIKQYKRSYMLLSPVDSTKIEEVEDISPEVNIGQPVATIKIPLDKDYSFVYWILKKQNGKSCGVYSFNPFEPTRSLSEYNINAHINSLKMLSDAPQETFNKCVKDAGYITSIGYLIDCGNSNNFLYDQNKKEINFVDINDEYNGNNQYADVLSGLLGGEFGMFYNSNAEESPQKDSAYEMSKTIVKKYFAAMKANKVKFEEPSSKTKRNT